MKRATQLRAKKLAYRRQRKVDRERKSVEIVKQQPAMTWRERPFAISREIDLPKYYFGAM